MTLLHPDTWARIRRNGQLQAGAAMVLLLAIAAIVGPHLLTADPLAVDFAQALIPPGADHWFGTDDLGRDVFARVIHAASIDLQIALMCVFLPFCIGSLVGLVSG
jgi:peptide/nickel transport system permease protein